MDQVDQFQDSSAINYPEQSVSNYQNKDGWKQMGFEEKKAAVNEEMRRMNQLPANSSYVIHRSRVLNKIMQLLSVQQYFAELGGFVKHVPQLWNVVPNIDMAERTTSQDEELELLFAGLSL